MRNSALCARAVVLIAPFLIGACDDQAFPTMLEPAAVAALQKGPSAPAGLVAISAASTIGTIWPYTGGNFSGVGQDPINLVFTGAADARNVRNALMSVNGTRGGPLAPFTCTWKDGIGSQQTAYTDAGGWSGSVIQMECGDYQPVRFHIRIFPAGNWSVANAHYDVLIPGTHDHQVLTWELGEQIVAYDLARSGFLTAPPSATGVINAQPTFRSIPPVIYNGLPVSLKFLTGGPFTPVTEPVGIPTNGSATVLALGEAPEAGGTQQDFVLTFGQYIPKPFCNGGTDLVRVDGPIRFQHQVSVSGSGGLTSETLIEGELVVRSFNPSTGQVGSPFDATVLDVFGAHVTDHNWTLQSTRDQQVAAAGGFLETLHQRLKVGEHGRPSYESTESCS